MRQSVNMLLTHHGTSKAGCYSYQYEGNWEQGNMCVERKDRSIRINNIGAGCCPEKLMFMLPPACFFPSAIFASILQQRSCSCRAPVWPLHLPQKKTQVGVAGIICWERSATGCCCVGHLLNVSLPTTICLTLVYSSTVRAKLFVPLRMFHLARHSFRHEVFGKERDVLQQLMG